jgi:hypothetical protein
MKNSQSFERGARRPLWRGFGRDSLVFRQCLTKRNKRDPTRRSYSAATPPYSFGNVAATTSCGRDPYQMAPMYYTDLDSLNFIIVVILL